MLNGIKFPAQHKPEEAATHIILEDNLGDAGKIEYQLAKGYQQGDDRKKHDGFAQHIATPDHHIDEPATQPDEPQT